MATIVRPAVRHNSVRTFSLEEYHWLIEHGFFREDERVELIGGVLNQMSPKGLRHAVCLSNFLHLLPAMISGKARIRAQDPITMVDSSSEPEPDLVLAAPRENRYLDHHPYPADVLLVVEIADSSLEQDRRVKVPVYAAAGIAEFWIVNLIDDQIEVYREPTSPAEGAAYYRQRMILSEPDTVNPIHLPDCSIAVKDVLPPRKRD